MPKPISEEDIERIVDEMMEELESNTCSSSRMSLPDYLRVLEALKARVRERASQVREELGEDL